MLGFQNLSHMLRTGSQVHLDRLDNISLMRSIIAPLLVSLNHRMWSEVTWWTMIAQNWRRRRRTPWQICWLSWFWLNTPPGTQTHQRNEQTLYFCLGLARCSTASDRGSDERLKRPQRHGEMCDLLFALRNPVVRYAASERNSKSNQTKAARLN